MTNRKPTAVSRMKQDYLRLKKDPIPYITAEPLATNLLEWHYVVKGPEDTPYQGGYYHGTLLFPREFPFKPPSIYMLTPNGRFKTNKRLCLSISDFHPDTWNPTWSVGTILTGLLSFMLESTPTLGSTESSQYEKQQYAKKSLAFNLKNPNFRELFPKICEEINCRLKNQQQMLQISTFNNKLIGFSKTVSHIPEGIDNKYGANNIVNNRRDHCGDVTYEDSISEINSNENYLNINAIFNNNAINSNTDLDSYCYLNSINSTLIAIISLSIFALIVNYVIKSLN